MGAKIREFKGWVEVLPLMDKESWLAHAWQGLLQFSPTLLYERFTQRVFIGGLLVVTHSICS